MVCHRKVEEVVKITDVAKMDLFSLTPLESFIFGLPAVSVYQLSTRVDKQKKVNPFKHQKYFILFKRVTHLNMLPQPDP